MREKRDGRLEQCYAGQVELGAWYGVTGIVDYIDNS